LGGGTSGQSTWKKGKSTVGSKRTESRLKKSLTQKMQDREKKKAWLRPIGQSLGRSKREGANDWQGEGYLSTRRRGMMEEETCKTGSREPTPRALDSQPGKREEKRSQGGKILT